jgi:hypothetical protein
MHLPLNAYQSPDNPTTLAASKGDLVTFEK